MKGVTGKSRDMKTGRTRGMGYGGYERCNGEDQTRDIWEYERCYGEDQRKKLEM